MMQQGARKAFPLDLARSSYSYIERPNPSIQALLAKHVVSVSPRARILDIGCGCGANAAALRKTSPGVSVLGIEPNARAAELARRACTEVFQGTLDEWAPSAGDATFDAVVLSDVLEHIADPIAFLRSLAALPSARNATWIVSVPNYAVWYNRVQTLLGVQGYAWSGLWDRTHLRFYTRKTARGLLEYCGLSVVDDACTPSIVQAAAPLLRRLFERDVEQGDHLALADSRAYELYRTAIEPIESQLCRAWPELLGFQVVFAAQLVCETH
jgi:SAM-dependent methyltransferase